MIEFETFLLDFIKNVKKEKKHRTYVVYLNSAKAWMCYLRGKRLEVTKRKDEDEYRLVKINGAEERITYLSDLDSPFLLLGFKRKRLITFSRNIKTGKKKLTGRTVNIDLNFLRNMLNEAKVKYNPAVGKEVKRYKENKDDPVIVDFDIEERLLEAYCKDPQKKHMPAITLLYLYTGMRMREVLNLEKGRVDLNKGIIKLIDTKNGETREIPLIPLLTNLLNEAMNNTSKDNPYVFPNPRNGKPYTKINKSLKSTMKAIGIDHYKVHWLRHSFCSRMKEAGVDDKTIMEIGGWKTRSMVDRYSHPSMEHKRSAIEKIQTRKNEHLRPGVPLKITLGDKQDQSFNLTTTLNSVNINAI
jgi:integrase